MSEFEQSEHYKEMLNLRNELFRRVGLMVHVEAEIRDSATVKLFMQHAKESMEIAVEQICEASPSDLNEITRCIVNIKVALYLKRALERLIASGLEAAKEAAEQETREAHDLDVGESDGD